MKPALGGGADGFSAVSRPPQELEVSRIDEVLGFERINEKPARPFKKPKRNQGPAGPINDVSSGALA